MAKREIIVELRLDDGQAVARFQTLNKEQEQLRIQATLSRKALRDLENEFVRLNKEQKKAGGSSEILEQKIAANRLEFERHSRELGVTKIKLQNVSAQTRELGNDLSGTTEAALRFRDKMAEATKEAIGQQRAERQAAQEQARARKYLYDLRIRSLQQEERATGKAKATEIRAEKQAAAEKDRIAKKELADRERERKYLLNLRLRSIQMEEQAERAAAQATARNQALASGMRFRDKIADATRAGLGAFGLNILGVTAGVTAFVSVIRNGVKTIAQFEQENANLAAILGTSRKEIEALTNSAIQLGPALGRLPSEVTALQTELAKLGFTQNEILASQEGIILLANATGEGLAQSAEIVAGTLKAFGLAATDTQRLVDVMAESFNSTSLDLNKFATAMSSVGPVAKAAGVSIEETTAIVGILSDANIDASTIGTSLRDIFIDLAAGGMTLDEALQQINDSQDKLTTANELFGKRSATTALVMAENVARADELAISLNNAGGAAEKMAKEQLATLTGAANRASAGYDAFILSLEKGDGPFGRALTRLANMAAGFFEVFAMLEAKSGTLEGLRSEFDAFAKTAFNADELADLNEDLIDQELDRIRLVNKAMAEQFSELVAAGSFDTLEFHTAALELKRKDLEAQLKFFQTNDLTDAQRVGYAALKVELQGLNAEIDRRNNSLKTQGAASEALTDTIEEEAKAIEATSRAVINAAGSIAFLEVQIGELKKQQAQSTKSEQFATYQKQIDELLFKIEQIKAEVTKLPTIQQTAAPIPEQELRTTGEKGVTEEIDNTTTLYNAKRILAEGYYAELNTLKASDYESEAAFTAAKTQLHSNYIAQKKALEETYYTETAQSAAMLFDALSGLAAEGSAEQKAFAIAAAIANTYVGVTKALSDLPPPASYIAAAATVAQGLSAVSKIQSTNPKGYAIGGYTEQGPKHKPVGVVHGGEWVAPKWQVNHPDYAPMIAWLEEQRTRRGGSSVPYVSGGNVGSTYMFSKSTSISVSDMMDIENAVSARLAFDRPVQVDVVEINKAQRNVRVAEKLSTA